jgi:DNA modification methylase
MTNMSSINLYNEDNMVFPPSENIADVIFADFIYENNDFSWVYKYWYLLKSGGVFIAMCDHHVIFDLGTYFKFMKDIKFVNHLVWKNEWGNHPKNRFHQCFDNILIFSKGKHVKFYSDRIQVPKATVNSNLNPSNRQTKTATAFINDICLTTVANERVKDKDGNLVKWQKPLALINRLLLPFTDEGDLIVDPFMGSGTVGVWCKQNNRNYIGIENNTEMFEVAKARINMV